MGDFFDSFGQGSVSQKVLFNDEDFAVFKECLMNASGLSIEDLHKAFKELVASTLVGKGMSVEEAEAAAPSDPYVAAVSDVAVLEQLAQEAASAAKCGDAVTDKEEWVPPPPDEEPETVQDME